MPAKPVQISVDVELLKRIDADPEARKQGRSAFVRSAITSYLAAKRRRAMELSIGAAYGNAADAMEAEVTDLVGAQEGLKGPSTSSRSRFSPDRAPERAGPRAVGALRPSG